MEYHKSSNIKDKDNNVLVDFNYNNLYVIGYSAPINNILKKKKLVKNLFNQK